MIHVHCTCTYDIHITLVHACKLLPPKLLYLETSAPQMNSTRNHGTTMKRNVDHFTK